MSGMASSVWKSARIIKKNANVDRIFIKEETRAHIRKVSSILKRPEGCRTEEEWRLLQQSEDVVELIRKRTRMKEQTKQRHLEIEDSSELLLEKCEQLASVIKNAESLIVYTGAGISTAASIPDYRGPNGVWTLLKQGKQLGSVDLLDADPTFTHMVIVELYKRGYIKRIVSQNCDGLHLRSGLPRVALSELHGNMYIEMCHACQPQAEFVRLFDVTEKTAMRRHKTGRRCHKCSSALFDTIVHFGEKGGHEAPYNWRQAVDAADSADVILCLGSSLKVLKKYSCLWGMHKPVAKRPRLYIVNLQWTPKDLAAALKINGRCDDVMCTIMKIMKIDVAPYSRNTDPIFDLASRLTASELKTTTRKMLSLPGSCLPLCSHEGKFRKGRKFARRQSFSHLPTRVMPSRQAKTAASYLPAVRISRKTGKAKTVNSSSLEERYSRSFRNSSGNSKCGSYVERSRADFLEEQGLQWSNSCRNLKPADKDAELGGKLYRDGFSFGCLQNLARDSEDVSPLHEANCKGSSISSSSVISGSCGTLQWREGKVLCDEKAKQNFVETFVNSRCWWNRVDSKTWLEGLQAYLLHISKQKTTDGSEMTWIRSTFPGDAFSEVNPQQTPLPCNIFGLSGDNVISKINTCPSVSAQVKEQSSNEYSGHVSYSNTANVQLSSDHWKQECSGETLNTSSKHIFQNGCSEQTAGANRNEMVATVPLLEYFRDDQFSEQFWKKNNMFNCNVLSTRQNRTGRGRETCNQVEKRTSEFCTLSDLKTMHDVLFESKERGWQTPNGDTRNLSEKTGRSVDHGMDLRTTHRPCLTDGYGGGLCDAGQRLRHPENVMANADLVRFMHSYCQQGKRDDKDALNPSCATEAAFCEEALKDTVSSSVGGSLKEPMKSKVLLERRELVKAGCTFEQLETLINTGTCFPPREWTSVHSTRCPDDDDAVAVTRQRFRCSNAPLIQACNSATVDDTSSVVSSSPGPEDGKSSSASATTLDSSVTLSSKASCGVPEREQCHHRVYSVPGWFGKGISTRKLKRKRLR